MSSKTYAELLDIINKQDAVIVTQNETITKLVNDNFEQENMINELMQDRVDAK